MLFYSHIENEKEGVIEVEVDVEALTHAELLSDVEVPLLPMVLSMVIRVLPMVLSMVIPVLPMVLSMGTRVLNLDQHCRLSYPKLHPHLDQCLNKESMVQLFHQIIDLMVNKL